MNRRWPHVRAALVGLHALAVVVLSLPAENIANPAAWQTPNAKADFGAWAARLQALGVDTTPEAFQAGLWRAATGYLDARARVVAPFSIYASATGAGQGWAMFASPQRHPGEIHVDVREQGAWRPIFRPRSDEHAWRRRQFDHNRFRKLSGRFARGFDSRAFDQVARWIGARAARDFPDATEVRVRLWRYQTLPPERVRAGERPQGKYEELRVIDAGALR